MKWQQLVGLDNLSEEYAFGRSESTGYTSAKKIPDVWVPTTCGYCSVGCGIEIGVKDGRAKGRRRESCREALHSARDDEGAGRIGRHEYDHGGNVHAQGTNNRRPSSKEV